MADPDTVVVVVGTSGIDRAIASRRAASGVTLPVDAGWLVQAPYAQYLQGNPIRSAITPS